jgi:hypothetical protein
MNKKKREVEVEKTEIFLCRARANQGLAEASTSERDIINEGKSFKPLLLRATTLLLVGEMLRLQLFRSTRRLKRLNGLNGGRAFSGSSRRQAEVELTIGPYLV